MAWRTKPIINLPPIPPQLDNPAIRKYMEQIHSAVQDFVKRLYDDITNGRVQHRIYSTIPTTDDVEEGEIVFYKSADVYRLYANVAGVMKYITMT